MKEMKNKILVTIVLILSIFVNAMATDTEHFDIAFPIDYQATPQEDTEHFDIAFPIDYQAGDPPNITINSPPTPANNSIDVDINVTFSFDVDDPNGDLLTVTLWKYESDGTWTTWNETTVTPPATVTFQRSLAYNTTYKWRASVQDETNLVYANFYGWTFTTIEEGETPNHPPVISDPSPADGATGVSYPSVILWVNVTDLDNDSIQVTFYNASDGSIIHQTEWIQSSDGKFRVGANYTNLAPATTYYWYVTANDGKTITTSPTWSFTTMEKTTGNGDIIIEISNEWIWIAIILVVIVVMMAFLIMVRW